MLAQRIVAEWRAAVWLLEQNNKGIAVPSAALLQQYILAWPRPLTTPEAEQHLLRTQSKRYSAKWLHFFRKRWDIRWKKLPARNPLPEDALRRKVRHNFSARSNLGGCYTPAFFPLRKLHVKDQTRIQKRSTFGTTFGPISGTESGPIFRRQNKILIWDLIGFLLTGNSKFRKRLPKVEPLLVPKMGPFLGHVSLPEAFKNGIAPTRSKLFSDEDSAAR
jgi:hypothetical protein